MSDIAELTIKINADNAAQATELLSKLTNGSKAAADGASMLEGATNKLAVVLGPTVLAGSLAIAVKGALALGESYVRLSEIAGTTSSAMSALDLPARLAGTSMDAVAQAVARLSKSLGEAQLGDVQKQGVFKALGIDVNDGREITQVLFDVSRAFSNMKDQNVAAAGSMLILNRSFAELRPFMKELTEQGGLQARTTNEQNEAAKRFEDTLVKISFSAQNTRMSLAEGMLPALQSIATAFSQLERNTELAHAVGETFGNGLRVIAELAIRTGTGVLTLGNYIAGLAAITGRMAEKDWVGAMNIANDLDAKIAEIQAKSERLLANLHNAGTGSGSKGPKPDGADEAAIAGIGQEEALRRLMKDKELFEARMTESKAFGEQYSNLIKLNNQLVAEEYKQGLMSEAEMLRRQAANEQERLQVLIISLEEQKRLSEAQGNKAKAQEATSGIAQANAAIVANEVLTQAKITSAREVADLAFKRGIEVRRAELREGQLTEFEQLQKKLAEEENLIEIWQQAGADREQEAGIMKANLYAQYENKKTEILDNMEKQRWGIQKRYHTLNAESATAFFEYMAVMMNSHNRAAFEIAKAASIGKAIMDTYTAANGAFSAMSGIPYVGPALGAAAAAAAIVAGLANVQQIRSQQFGGGGGASPAVPAFNASPSTGLPTNAGTPNAGQAQAQQPTTIINLHGQSFSAEQIRDLFDQFNENTRDGGRVVIA